MPSISSSICWIPKTYNTWIIYYKYQSLNRIRQSRKMWKVSLCSCYLFTKHLLKQYFECTYVWNASTISHHDINICSFKIALYAFSELKNSYRYLHRLIQCRSWMPWQKTWLIAKHLITSVCSLHNEGIPR